MSEKMLTVAVAGTGENKMLTLVESKVARPDPEPSNALDAYLLSKSAVIKNGFCKLPTVDSKTRTGQNENS